MLVFWGSFQRKLCYAAVCGGMPTVSSYFPRMESMQRSFPTFFSVTFPLMEKSPKDQADFSVTFPKMEK